MPALSQSDGRRQEGTGRNQGNDAVEGDFGEGSLWSADSVGFVTLSRRPQEAKKAAA